MFERKHGSSNEHFNSPEAAARYDRHMRRSGAGTYRAFMKRLERIEFGERVLDVGAGTGYLTSLIAREYPRARITALDPSEAMVDFGRKYMQGEGLSDRVEYVLGRAEDWPLLESLGRFDLICSSLVLHEFKDARPVFEHMLSMLNPDGKLFMLDLRRVWWLYWIPSNQGFYEGIRAAFRSQELTAMLSEAGARRIQVENVFPFMLLAVAGV